MNMKCVFSSYYLFQDLDTCWCFRHVSRNMECINVQHVNTYFPTGTYSVFVRKYNKQLIYDIKLHSIMDGDGS